MKERESDTTLNFTDFENKRVEIILDNGMHYTGKLLSSGIDYVKIVDKYSQTVFIVIKSISSIREVQE